MIAVARGAAGAATLLVTVVILHRLGAGPLAAPPLGSPTEIRDWATQRDAVTIGVASVRLLALAVAYHLVATTALAVVGRCLGSWSLVHAADLLTLPPLRGTVRRIVGLGLSVSVAVSSPVTSASAGAGDRASVEVIDAHRTSARLGVIERVVPPGRAAIVRLPSPAATSARIALAGHPTRGRQRATGDAPQGAPLAAPPTTHVVRPGDHLWSIAEARLGDHLGRPATDREITPYWRSVVAANPQLTQPDLLFPGDRITVPPLPR